MQKPFLDMTLICSHASNDIFRSQRKLTEEQEQWRIVETAAKIIQNAIKELDSNNNSYPSPDGLESSRKNAEYLPKSLSMFLDNLFVGKEK